MRTTGPPWLIAESSLGPQLLVAATQYWFEADTGTTNCCGIAHLIVAASLALSLPSLFDGSTPATASSSTVPTQRTPLSRLLMAFGELYDYPIIYQTFPNRYYTGPAVSRQLLCDAEASTAPDADAAVAFTASGVGGVVPLGNKTTSTLPGASPTPRAGLGNRPNKNTCCTDE